MRVIVLLTDSFRYDHLGFLGRKPVETPALDAFAQEATMFHQHYCGSFPTLPNREDFLTGKTGFPFHGWGPLAENAVTMPQVLEKNGIPSQLITDTPHMMKLGFNYHKGFTSYLWVRGQEADHPLTRLNYPIDIQIPHEKTRPIPKAFGKYTLADMQRWDQMNHWHYEEDKIVSRVADTACEWLQDNYQAENFLLWCDFFDPHEPWDPPAYFVKKYDPDYKGIPMFHPNYGKAEDYTPEELHNLWAHYAAEVSLVDKSIGRVLRLIKDTGIWEDTMIVWTTDHGIYIGEHNFTGKSNINPRDDRGNWPLLDEICHTPLMIKPAGGRKVAEVHERVQPIDLFPTVLDAFNMTTDMTKLEGLSMTPLLQGKSEGWQRNEAISAQCMVAANKDNPQSPNWITINDGEWTLIYGGRPQDSNMLFNTKTDPLQSNNLIATEREVADRLYARSIEYLKSMNTSEERLATYQKCYAKD